MQRFRDLIFEVGDPGSKNVFRLLFCGFNFCGLPKISGYTVYTKTKRSRIC